MTDELIHIDGAQGEGGGQILRTALSLSAVTGRGFSISRIRAWREKPGLMRQHLACVLAARDVSGASVDGAEVGSQELTFRPGQVFGGQYHFSIGTAGSTMLVLQTVLPPLMVAGRESTVVIEGGTHNGMAPTAEFIDRAFLPVLAKMGPNVELNVERRGFYPAGGGRVLVRIAPAARGSLAEVRMHERGRTVRRSAVSVVSRLTNNVAQRELAVIRERLGFREDECFAIDERSPGPGNVLLVTIASEHVTEVFSSVGSRTLSSEAVAEAAVQEAREYLKVDAPVGQHLADQLLLPMALAGAGSFSTGSLSEHTRTNIATIGKFLDVPIRTAQEGDVTRVMVGSSI